MNLSEIEIKEFIELAQTYGYQIDYSTITLSHKIDDSILEINPNKVIYRRQGRKNTWDNEFYQAKKNFKLARKNIELK